MQTGTSNISNDINVSVSGGGDNKKKLYILQIYRGFAAVAVLVFHFRVYSSNMFRGTIFFELIRFGFSGVDFFFVLSGFIIFYNHYQDIGNRQKLPAYLKKRVIRVYPIYWVYSICAVVIFFIVKKRFGTIVDPATDFHSVQYILRNIFLYPQLESGLAPILPPAWTLSYEVFFYMVFALLILFKRSIPKFIIAVWIILMLLNIPSSGIKLIDDIALSPLNFEFLMGACIALIYIKTKQKIPKIISIISLVAGIVWLFFTWRSLNVLYGGDVFTYTAATRSSCIAGIPYALITFASIGLFGEIEKKGLIKKALIYLGDASYSIYLTHYVIKMYLEAFLSGTGKQTHFHLHIAHPNYVGVVVTLLIGCVAYSVIERPLLKIIRKKILYKSKNNHTPKTGFKLRQTV